MVTVYESSNVSNGERFTACMEALFATLSVDLDLGNV